MPTFEQTYVNERGYLKRSEYTGKHIPHWYPRQVEVIRFVERERNTVLCKGSYYTHDHLGGYAPQPMVIFWSRFQYETD